MPNRISELRSLFSFGAETIAPFCQSTRILLGLLYCEPSYHSSNLMSAGPMTTLISCSAVMYFSLGVILLNQDLCPFTSSRSFSVRLDKSEVMLHSTWQSAFDGWVYYLGKINLNSPCATFPGKRLASWWDMTILSFHIMLFLLSASSSFKRHTIRVKLCVTWLSTYIMSPCWQISNYQVEFSALWTFLIIQSTWFFTYSNPLIGFLNVSWPTCWVLFLSYGRSHSTPYDAGHTRPTKIFLFVLILCILSMTRPLQTANWLLGFSGNTTLAMWCLYVRLIRN